MNLKSPCDYYCWKSSIAHLTAPLRQKLGNELLDLAFQASVAHWQTDTRALVALAARDEQQNVKRWFKLLMEWPQERAAHLFDLLGELQFLLQSASPSKTPKTLIFQLSKILDHVLVQRPSFRQNNEAGFQALRSALLRAGELMACGHYLESIGTLELQQKVLDLGPIAYQLRSSVIRGICYQAMGYYGQADSELLLQERLQESLEDPFLHCAVLRRRLSFAIETENFSIAKKLELRLRVLLESISSEFLAVLFLQERIKLSFALHLLGEKTLWALQKEQEKFIENSSINSVLFVPIEERCEMALRLNKPKQALRWIRQQVGICREKGMVNGLLVSETLLLKCQMLNGAEKAAFVTLRELEYLCKEYQFGRDALKVKVLGFLWEKRFGSVDKLQERFKECQIFSDKLGLKQHSWSLNLLAFFLFPSYSRLQKAMPFRKCKLIELAATLRTVAEWLELQGDATSLPHHLVSDAIRRLELEQYVCWFFADFGVFLAIYPQGSLAEDSDAQVLIHWLHLRPASTHYQVLKFAILRLGLTHFSLENLHKELFPSVIYKEYRHKIRVQGALQKFRSFMRRSLADLLTQYPQIPADLGLSHLSGWQFSLPCEWLQTAELQLPLFRRNAVSNENILQLKTGAVNKTPGVTTYAPPPRNNAPVLAETIALRKRMILQWLTAHGPTSGSQMSLEMGFARKTLHVYLRQMLGEGLIGLTGRGRNARYFKVPTQR